MYLYLNKIIYIYIYIRSTYFYIVFLKEHKKLKCLAKLLNLSIIIIITAEKNIVILVNTK